MGGRVNPNVPKGRDVHRAMLLKELRALGVTAKELAHEDHSLEELKRAGFTVKEILNSRKCAAHPSDTVVVTAVTIPIPSYR